jgi:hypothetical protein
VQTTVPSAAAPVNVSLPECLASFRQIKAFQLPYQEEFGRLGLARLLERNRCAK